MATSEAVRELNESRSRDVQVAEAPDFEVSLFSERGFALAQRVARMFASSDAVPAQFRQWQIKRNYKGEIQSQIENHSAMGNCLVAIEMARATGMSIVSVMQNANIIDGKLSWSATFWIAAINACGRFTPLRFEIKPGDEIDVDHTETYWESGDKKTRKQTVRVRDYQCIAHAYEKENGRRIDGPRIESIPVTMRMAVEEGWYSRPGSKWRTPLFMQMLQYRAATFFGRLNAPDVVMGLGQTTEERMDTIDAEIDPDTGILTPVDEIRDRVKAKAADSMASELNRAAKPTPAGQPAATPNANPEPSAVSAAPAAPSATEGPPAAPLQDEGQGSPASDDLPPQAQMSIDDGGPTLVDVVSLLNSAKTVESLDEACVLAQGLPGPDRAKADDIAAKIRARLTGRRARPSME